MIAASAKGQGSPAVAQQPIVHPYDEIQHDPISTPPTGLANLPIEEIIEQVTEWFDRNFEDPVQTTPYESAEGGYQYIWGGPYETRDIIENIFADELTDQQISEVVDAIEIINDEWVPHSRRLRSPDDHPDQLELPLDAEELHRQLLAQVAAAEARLAELAEQERAHAVAGIGHNNPPEAIESPPATKQDIEELRAAFETLKAQPAEPEKAAQESIEQARITIAGVAAKVGGWLATQANTFVTKAVEEAGKQTGGWAVKLAGGYLLFRDQLHQIAETISHWLHALNLPF